MYSTGNTSALNAGSGSGEYMSLCTDPIPRNLFIRNGTLLHPSSVPYIRMQLDRFFSAQAANSL